MILRKMLSIKTTRKLMVCLFLFFICLVLLKIGRSQLDRNYEQDILNYAESLLISGKETEAKKILDDYYKEVKDPGKATTKLDELKEKIEKSKPKPPVTTPPPVTPPPTQPPVIEPPRREDGTVDVGAIIRDIDNKIEDAKTKIQEARNLIKGKDADKFDKVGTSLDTATTSLNTADSILTSNKNLIEEYTKNTFGKDEYPQKRKTIDNLRKDIAKLRKKHREELPEPGTVPSPTQPPVGPGPQPPYNGGGRNIGGGITGIVFSFIILGIIALLLWRRYRGGGGGRGGARGGGGGRGGARGGGGGARRRRHVPFSSMAPDTLKKQLEMPITQESEKASKEDKEDDLLNKIGGTIDEIYTDFFKNKGGGLEPALA